MIISRVVLIVVSFSPLLVVTFASSLEILPSFVTDKEPVTGVTIYSDGLDASVVTFKVLLLPETTEDAAPPVELALILISPVVTLLVRVTPLPATKLATTLLPSIFKPCPTFTS